MISDDKLKAIEGELKAIAENGKARELLVARLRIEELEAAVEELKEENKRLEEIIEGKPDK